jgi:hypothetical protein
MQEVDLEESAAESTEVEEITFEAVAENQPEINNEEPELTTAPAQISFEDLLGANYAEPEFVKPNPIQAEAESEPIDEVVETALEAPLFSLDEEPELVLELPVEDQTEKAEVITPLFDLASDEPKIATETPAKGFVIGLNDRVGFIHQLFDGSPEDYNRVLSQLMTYHTFEEAEDFIRSMIKPDYNNWDGKSEYEERFMDVVARKFQ